MCRDFIGSIVNGDKIDGLFCISCSGKSWERCSINTILYELNSLFNIIVVFVFFFFKQKEAYERRISDWSSDVCSSDLRPWRLDLDVAGRDLEVRGLGIDSRWTTDLKVGGTADAPRFTGRADLVRGDYEFAGRNFRLERGIIRFRGESPKIGRASGRERGCQSVVIWVVAGLLTNK